MLTVNPAKRITAADALKHPWICVSKNSLATITYAEGEGLKMEILFNYNHFGTKISQAPPVEKLCRNHSEYYMQHAYTVQIFLVIDANHL